MDTIPPLSAPILLDGATGTELYKRGMPHGVCTEQWVLEHPDALLELQRAYVDAGSQVLIAPTFGANRVTLARYGLSGQVSVYNRRLAALTRKAAGGKARVAGDLAPTGKSIVPFGDASFEELVDIYTEQAAALEAAGVDLFLLETTMTMAEARAAVLACKSVSAKPVWVTFTCDENGRTPSGTDVLAALIVMQGMGVDAFGLNCCAGPAEMLEQLRRLTPAPGDGGEGRIPLHAGGAGLLRRPLRRGRRAHVRRLLRHHAGAHRRPGGRGGGGGLLRLCPAGAGSRRDPLRQREGGPVHHPRRGRGRDHRVLLAAEEEAPQGALKIAILEEDDLDIFAENQYVVKDALCLWSDVPELLERALRLYQGRAFWDGTGDLDDAFLEEMSHKYGLVLL